MDILKEVNIMEDYQYFVSEEIKMGKPYITVKVNYQADDVAMRVVAYSKPRFLPPVTASEVNGKHSFIYDISADGFVKSTELGKEMSPNEFLVFMKNLTDIVMESDDYFLNQRNLLMEKEYVYIHPDDFRVRVIYMPFIDSIFQQDDITRQVYESSRQFSRATTDEWNQIILRMWAMTDKTPVYDASALYTTLLNESKLPKPTTTTPPQTTSIPPVTPPLIRPIVNSTNANRVSGSGRIGGKAPAPSAVEKAKGLFSGLSGILGGKKKDDDLQLEDMTLVDADDVTMVDSPDIRTLPMATLSVIEGGQNLPNMPITKADFYIGRNRDAVDLCFDGDSDKGIGRVHALIKFENGQFFLIDQVSTNGTYLNNSRLEPNTPTLLQNGDIIKLHRKEMVFSCSV